MGAGEPPEVARAARVGFGREAASYAGVRPSYPDDALDAVVALAPSGGEVLDLAAGTGIFTRQLLERGLDVVAVEPVAAMRDELVASTPGVDVVDGTAERIPFPDDAFDLVTAAQAFHWFDAPAALAEVCRVLRPGGALAMVWNARDHSEAWIREWTAVVDRLALAEGDRPYHRHQDTDWVAVVAAAGGFEPVVHTVHDNPRTITPDGLVERARSMSYVGALPPDRQAVVLDAVRELVATHPDLQGRDSIDFPHHTHLYVARRAEP